MAGLMEDFLNNFRTIIPIISLILSALAIILWIFMLIDAIKRDFGSKSSKIVWIILLILTNWIGALIYLFAVKIKKRNPEI